MWTIAALAADVAILEQHGPSTLHPLYARTDADPRAHELLFDWLFRRDPRSGALVSRIVAQSDIAR